ncbi:sodium:inorganic phosphate symporter [Ephemerocybe angulata]|uniref:Phosphate transporter n=1 Tax=Ephemerocybe angulata TaxID=980116 RepID=A0A8H6IHW9_9AGAR|nr:sodium:inorganic phosphate symporter [Tulosesus angulatus]
MPLHHWDYLFAIGTIFAGLDAYMIGANDVANSFATSVSSKSLTLKQACLAAALMEFLGAVLVGARVTSTIKDGIIPATAFKGNAGVQLLAFTCAIVASSSWLTIATRMSWPVSTTYSIVSAVIGVGIAAAGWKAPAWGWNGGKGVATIFAGFAIAPAIAGAFGIVIYSLVKFGVLVRQDSTRWALFTAPLVFFLVGAVSTMAIIFKGSPSLGLKDLPGNTLAAAIVGTAAVVALLSILFWLPFVHAKPSAGTTSSSAPLLWKRAAPADAGAVDFVPNYHIRDANELDGGSKAPAPEGTDSEKGDEKRWTSPPAPRHLLLLRTSALLLPKSRRTPSTVPGFSRRTSISSSVTALAPSFSRLLPTAPMSISTSSRPVLKGPMVLLVSLPFMRVPSSTPNDTEHLYSFLQVFSACVASFAHGANDVSNAIGPFSVIYHVWSSGELSGSKTPVPVWALVFGAGMLVVGLATYGYNIMAVLGNRITLMSPSRGFSMELGSSITVILAAQYGIPVSTTMCIVGSTIGVSLCNGDWRATNWRAIGWIFMGWVMTVPIAATVSGCLMGIILNAPHF